MSNRFRLALALLPALSHAPRLAAQELPPERPWTFMIYAAADNNADGPALHFVDRIRKALDDDPGMELILFIDRSTEFSRDTTILGAEFAGARVYRLRRDSADAENVGRFVSFCKRRYPAERYGLLIYSHARAATPGPTLTRRSVPKTSHALPRTRLPRP
jgi:clostripain